MPRLSPADAHAEIDRLHDAVLAAFRANAEAMPDPRWDESLLIPRDRYHDLLASGQESAAALLRGLREALNDFAPRGSRHPREVARDAAFLRAFTARTGQSFWDFAPHPKRRLKVILAASEPLGEDDLRFLSGMLADDMVPPRDLARAREILASAQP